MHGDARPVDNFDSCPATLRSAAVVTSVERCSETFSYSHHGVLAHLKPPSERATWPGPRYAENGDPDQSRYTCTPGP